MFTRGKNFIIFESQKLNLCNFKYGWLCVSTEHEIIDLSLYRNVTQSIEIVTTAKQEKCRFMMLLLWIVLDPCAGLQLQPQEHHHWEYHQMCLYQHLQQEEPSQTQTLWDEPWRGTRWDLLIRWNHWTWWWWWWRRVCRDQSLQNVWMMIFLKTEETWSEMDTIRILWWGGEKGWRRNIFEYWNHEIYFLETIATV